MELGYLLSVNQSFADTTILSEVFIMTLSERA